MKIDCMHCGTEFDMREGSTKCPHCDEVAVVDAEVVDAIDIVEDDESPSQPQKKALTSSTHIHCPMCDEKISKAAKKCRYCGEQLSPDERSGVWRDGKILVMSQGAELPYRCVKTNEPAETFLRRKLSWHPPAIFATILAGVLIYVILAMVLSKKADIRVPISHRIRKRRTMAIIVGWLASLGGVGLTILTCILLADSQNPAVKDALPFIVIGGIVFVIFSAVFSSSIASIVTPTKITDRHVWLRGVNADYLDLLPEWPGE